MQTRQWIAAACALAGLVGLAAQSGCKCESEPEEVEAEREALKRLPADRDPLFEHLAGPMELEEQEPLDLSATATATDGDGIIVVVEGIPQGDWWSAVDPLALRLQSDRAGVATMSEEAGQRKLWLRVDGTKPLPDKMTLSWGSPGVFRSESKGKRPRTIRISAVQAAEVREGLAGDYYRALADGFGVRARGFTSSGRRGHTAFAAFAAARARKLSGGGPTWDRGLRPAGKSDLGETMSLYSGLTSVDEALQVDRGLRGIRDRAERAIDIQSIDGVGLPTHDWAAMTQAAGGAKDTEPLAAVCPSDALYLYFPKAATLVDAADWLVDVFEPVSQAFEEAPGNWRLRERYERELGIDSRSLVSAIESAGGKGVALLLHDPYLREGSPLAIAIESESASALAKAIDAKRTGSAQTGLRAHQEVVGDVVVLSNSRPFLDRVVEAARTPAKSLAQSPDFVAFRAEKALADGEGYLFLSDAFVAAAVSPAMKIASSRRQRARADMMAVQHAAMLYGWMRGRLPASTAELVASGLLDEAELTDAEGGSLVFDPDTGASSKTWGRPAQMAHLLDVPVTLVSEQEKKAYEQFRQTYQTYWRSFIDPVGARLAFDPQGSLDVDVRIMPLIESSDYDELVERAGTARIQLPTPVGAMEWAFAVGKDAQIRRDLNSLGSLGPGQEWLSWFGEWIVVGFVDHMSLWDLALITGSIIPEASERRSIFEPDPKDARNANIQKALADAPLYAAIDVSNPAGLAATLTQAKAFATSAAPGMVEWGPVDPIGDTQVVRIRATSDTLGRPSPELYYATKSNRLVLALSRSTLTWVLDRFERGEGPKRVEDTETAVTSDTAQAMFSIHPRKGWSGLMRTLAGAMETEVRRASYTALVAVSELRRAAPNRSDWKSLVRPYLVYQPESPHGGEFSEADGEVALSRYGTLVAPSFASIPDKDSRFHRALRRVKSVSMGLGVEGQGDGRALRVHTEIRFSPE